jgi:enediyne polyketide synthase
LKLEATELPLRRFLERPRVHYPGVELIVEAELSAISDPYLEEHLFHQQRLLPAVVGLEAMAQVAMALTGAVVPPDFENVQLRRPVVISDKGASTIRLAALRHGDGVVEVCLRAEETDFQVDHFRATCRFAATKSAGAPLARGVNGSPAAQVPLDPRRDLYGPILFHEGRFQRVGGYRLLKAKECVAEIHSTREASWFGPYLAGDLVLGDPAARDAALHAIQACVPHRRILPAGIDRVAIHSLDPGPRSVHAWQRRREDNDFVYDLEITNADHQVIERWEGLRLRAVEELPPYLTWPHPLLAACLERRLEEFGAASSFTVVLERQGKSDRSSSGDAAMQMALGESVRILRRPDGKPEAVHGRQISAAHAGGFTLAVAGTGPVACDLEPVSARSIEVWRDLLGWERADLAERIARERSESYDTSATRLWTMIECLKKSGSSIEAAIRLDVMTDDGWVLLNSGALTVATCVATVRGAETPLAMALAYSMAETMTRRPAAMGTA